MKLRKTSSIPILGAFLIWMGCAADITPNKSKIEIGVIEKESFFEGNGRSDYDALVKILPSGRKETVSWPDFFDSPSKWKPGAEVNLMYDVGDTIEVYNIVNGRYFFADSFK